VVGLVSYGRMDQRFVIGMFSSGNPAILVGASRGTYSKGPHTHASTPSTILSHLVYIFPAEFDDVIVGSGAGVDPNVP